MKLYPPATGVEVGAGVAVLVGMGVDVGIGVGVSVGVGVGRAMKALTRALALSGSSGFAISAPRTKAPVIAEKMKPPKNQPRIATTFLPPWPRSHHHPHYAEDPGILVDL